MKDYKKILEGVVDIINTAEKSDIGFANICTYIGENCPELKESEDEKIRKELIEFVKSRGGFKQEYIAWLEKQGEHDMGISEATKQKLEDNLNKALEKETPESWNKFLDEQCEQKPAWSEEDNVMFSKVVKILYKHTASDEDYIDIYYWLKSIKDRVGCEVNCTTTKEWSKEDETTKNNISHIIRQYDKISKKENQPCWYVGDSLLWMQNIKERVQPQPKQEWSEEDIKCLNRISLILLDASEVKQWWKEYRLIEKDEMEKLTNWLKSLRPQNTWKPSEEQMKVLETALLYNTLNIDDSKLLATLYQDLKKLK